jgi:glycosyltransferase involved in cell wall biosynthesis
MAVPRTCPTDLRILKMKFAFISTMGDLPWGGSEELWSQSASHLRKSGHQVYASVFHWSQNDSRLKVWRDQGVVLETRPGLQARPAQRLMRKLRGPLASFAHLKKFAPDMVVISQGYIQGGFAWAEACRAAGIPYAILVHCNSDLWWFADNEIADAASAYTHARKVFCVSQANLELLRLQVAHPLPNSCVVWNPCNVSRDPVPDWPETASILRLACIARLVPEAKGQDILLRVLAEPKWRDRPVHLDFFGSGPHAGQLRQMADSLQLQNVTFRGHVNDIRSIWREHHLLVLASRYEGLPLSLVEAMWCARPAVVTAVGGNAELCLHRQTGFVAPAAEASLFSDALEQAWEQRAEWPRMGKAARARVESLVPENPLASFCETIENLC